MMPNLDTQIRDSELNLGKYLKHKDEKHRRAKLAKFLVKKRQEKQHNQLQPTHIKSKSTDHKYEAKDNLAMLFHDYCLNRYLNVRNNTFQDSLNFKRFHGKVVLTNPIKKELYNIRLTTQLGLATCKTSSYKVCHADDYTNDVGYIPYKLKYNSKFNELMQKCSHLKLYSHLQALRSFFGSNTVFNSTILLSVSSAVLFPMYVLYTFFTHESILGYTITSSNLFNSVMGAACAGCVLAIFFIVINNSICDIFNHVNSWAKRKAKSKFLAHQHDFINDLLKISNPSQKSKIKELL